MSIHALGHLVNDEPAINISASTERRDLEKRFIKEACARSRKGDAICGRGGGGGGANLVA